MGAVGDIRDAMFGPIIKEQAMNDAEFDRALGAWEDNQLNSHLAEEDAWDQAYEKAQNAVWDMKLSELHEMSPGTVSEDIESVAEAMTEHVAGKLLEGGE